MKKDWLVGRRGVVTMEALSVDQIYDHCLGDENHDELLRVVVNKLRQSDRMLEAARILQRKAKEELSVAQTHRNDKQLIYFRSLLEDDEELADRFGPVEEKSMVIPYKFDEVYKLPGRIGGRDAVEVLENLVLDAKPMAMGVWWAWRCFDPTTDKHASAALIALSWPGAVALVDVMELEKDQSDGFVMERRHKNALHKIMEAPHILKVVHGMDAEAYRALQLGLVVDPRGSERPTSFASVAPALDVAVVHAFMEGSSVSSEGNHLNSMVNRYLRVECCHFEAMSNFEKQPRSALRLSQQHYLLSLAWAPLMILRACCVHGILQQEEVLDLSFIVGVCDGQVCAGDWDQVLHEALSFGKEAGPNLQRRQAAAEGSTANAAGSVGAAQTNYGTNLWKDLSQVRQLPRPSSNQDSYNGLHRAKNTLTAKGMAVPESRRHDARCAVASLFDPQSCTPELEAFYNIQA